MDAELSYRLKYGCLSHGGLTPRLMVVSSETGSVYGVALHNIYFLFNS